MLPPYPDKLRGALGAPYGVLEGVGVSVGVTVGVADADGDIVGVGVEVLVMVGVTVGVGVGLNTISPLTTQSLLSILLKVALL